MPVVMLSAFGTVATAVEAIKAGANDFLVKPFSQDELDEVLERLADSRPRFGPESNDLITENAGMRTLLSQASQAAKTQATVLVQAESGTGKELAGALDPISKATTRKVHLWQ